MKQNHLQDTNLSGIGRRTVVKTIGLGSLGLMATTGTASGRGRQRDGASGDDTLVDVAVAADDFEILVAAVQAAGLVDALSGNRQLTVFAPTDEAFGELGITEDNVDEVEDLANILLYHVTNGRRYSQSVVRVPRIRMLNGEDVQVDGTKLNDDQANIVDTDIEASNGVIHIIDGVLSPS